MYEHSNNNILSRLSVCPCAKELQARLACPVTAKMIHSAVWECKRLVLKDGRPLHMVKFTGAVRNFYVNIKYVQIDVEDGTGLVWVIL
jgi:hypothetical protein